MTATLPAPRWRHHHAVFVLAVFSRYNLNFYRDRQVNTNTPVANSDDWTGRDRELIIEEGRRQVDGQYAQLQYITTRAGALLPLAVAIALFFLSAFGDVPRLTQPAESWARILVGTGSALTLWGAMIMGALIGGRAVRETTDTTQLTHRAPGVETFLAEDYPDVVIIGENTTAARLTHLGTGVTWIVSGAVIGAVGLLVLHWSPT